MKYDIVVLKRYTGSKAIIYSIIPEGETHTLYDNFLIEHYQNFKEELKDIGKRLFQMGNTTGARESYFKLAEGKPGDGVCALYDSPEKKLRLYCIRFGSIALILGDGGEKRSNVRAWQDDIKLKAVALDLIKYAKDINNRIKTGDLHWDEDRSELTGNLTNTL